MPRTPPEHPEGIGETLRRARTARGLSLRDVASAVGVTYAYIADLEMDRRLPSDVTAVKLARALSVDQDILLARLGRLRPEVTAFLQEHPENAQLLSRIVLRRLSREQLERLLSSLDQTSESSPT